MEPQLIEALTKLQASFEEEYDQSPTHLESKQAFLTRKLTESIKALEPAGALASQGLASFTKIKETLPIAEKVKKNLPNYHAYLDETPKEMLDLTNEEMELLYDHACRALEENRLEESLGMFFFLAVLNLGDFRYALGVGLCHFLLGHLEEAEKGYEAALRLARGQAKPYIFAAEYYHAIGQTEKAEELLDKGFTLLDPEQVLLRQKADYLKNIIKHID